jgi:hypothetical protein
MNLQFVGSVYDWVDEITPPEREVVCYVSVYKNIPFTIPTTGWRYANSLDQVQGKTITFEYAKNEFGVEVIEELKPKYYSTSDTYTKTEVDSRIPKVVNTTGASATSVMSQKAVTDAIQDFADKDYVDAYAAAAENALTYLNNNKVDFDLVPVSTETLVFNIDDEYFYEEHDNIII